MPQTRVAESVRLARRLIPLAVVNGVVLLTGLCAIELTFGNWLNPNRINRLHLIRDSRFVYEVEERTDGPPKRIVYTRDEWGFRGTYESLSDIEILTLGGSTTDQRDIDDSETWQVVLSRSLTSDGEVVSVVNAGVDGQSTYGHLASFELWLPLIPALRVDYYLMYVGINDLYAPGDWSVDLLVERASTLGGRFNLAIAQNSALYELFRLLRGIHAARDGLQALHHAVDLGKLSWDTLPFLDHAPHPMDRRVRAYGERIGALLDRIEAADAGAICVTQPARWTKRMGPDLLGASEPANVSAEGRTYLTRLNGHLINGLDLQALLDQLNLELLRVCRERGAVTLDLAAELHFEDTDFIDFTHNTSSGAEKIGLYLADNLRPLLSAK